MRFTLLLAFSLIGISFPQTIISGRVTTSNGKPLFAANVVLKDTYDGASTNEDGTYSFTTFESGEMILLATYIGYKPEERKINISGGEIGRASCRERV